MHLRRMIPAAAAAILLLSTLAGASSAAPGQPGYRILWDDFKNGFSTTGPDARWTYFAAGPYVGDDGIATTSPRGLRVVSGTTHPVTGEPAFTRTLAPEGQNPWGLPGGLDHVKWLVFTNHLSARGYPGFDAIDGQELACEAWFSGQTYGTAGHPFGDAVADPDDDLRLASVAMNSIDLETMMVFDFILTNRRIYAIYERLPFAREVLGNYASFTFQVPLVEREPGETHHLKIAYDRAAGVVRWLVDDVERFRVERLGYRIDRSYMTLDHGGAEQLVAPQQLACGMGMFTILDGAVPNGQGLVRLSSAPDFYFDPLVGEPAPLSFLEEGSPEASRLFGQGAEVRVKRYVVSSRPVPE